MAKPLTVQEFPLTDRTAKKIINDIAKNYSKRVKFGTHAKERMRQRDVTNMQVLQVLSSHHSRFIESPAQTPKGSFKATLQGISAGVRINVTVDIRRHEDDPNLYVVTVYK